jgi:hypothetical protein
MPKPWVVTYRMGGTERFTWRRSLAYATKEEAVNSANEELRLGRLAYAVPYDLSMSIGLPETWNPEDSVGP